MAQNPTPQNPDPRQQPAPMNRAPQNYGMPGQYPVNPNLPPQMPQGQKPPQKKQPQKKSKKFTILGIFTLIGLVLGGLLFATVNRYARSMTIIEIPGAPILDNSGKVKLESTLDPNAEEEEQVKLADITSVKGDPWDGITRITCLAMGLDYRDWESNATFSHSDSMMLLTYDPVTKMSGMLSIPRDLWVAIPNHGYGRINTAYFLGESENLPGGGPQLAMETVELFLGIDIQYYAVISFNGFVDFIDSIDKLAINVRDQITVDPIGPGNTVTLYPGVQDLDGATALAYARQRYTGGGDFERAQRQQDVIYALYKQMTWQLPQLLLNADQLYASLSKALRTNLTFNDMMKLAWTVVDLDPSQIVRSVIAPPYQVEFRKTTDGQDILVPIPDKIREARDIIFSTSLAAAPATVSEDPVQLIQAEGAHITLLNGSSNPDILNRTVTYLQQFGITIDATGQAANSYTNSLVINKGKPFTAKFLKDTMGIPTEAITMDYQPGGSNDLVLTITDAWANSNPM